MTTFNGKGDNMKHEIIESSEKSKKIIRDIIDLNAKQLGAAVESNKALVDSIQQKLHPGVAAAVDTQTLNKAFGKSVEFAEEALDGIINSYARQMELNVELNTKLQDVIKSSTSKIQEKALDLLLENFEASRQLAVKNTSEMFDFYNKHSNMALNFNQKFGETIQAQMDVLSKVQSKEQERFTGLLSDWWKHTEKAAV
jgi:hypothetical protein